MKAETAPVWLVSPRKVGDTVHLELHAVIGTVALCGRTAAEGGFFKPRPGQAAATCKTCNTRTRTPDGCISAAQLIDSCSISYRQLDYWIRTELIHPIDRYPGSGAIRYFTPEEATVVIKIATLVAIGFSPQLAAIAARNEGQLAPGVKVVIEEHNAA